MCAFVKYYLALNEIHRVGAASLSKLLRTFGDVSEIFNASVQQLNAVGLNESVASAIVHFDWRRIEPSLRWQTQANQHIVTINDSSYPELLREIASPPLLLYVKGALDCLHRTQLAVVGSRHPTPIGRENAKHFSATLAKTGLVVTSGLALGIDTASHQGALQADQQTIAVLGTGLSTIYPASNRWLAQEIAEKGALVSEFPLDAGVRREHFPRRNRLISGLSRGVLVVEAAAESGSLITARFALEQGREVFAIPGSIHNPLSKGCHQLLHDGAKLVQCAEDIIEELLPMPVTASCDRQPSMVATLGQHAQHVLSCIDEGPTSLALILQRSQLSAPQLSSQLLDLEMRGLIRSAVGGYQRLSV